MRGRQAQIGDEPVDHGSLWKNAPVPNLENAPPERELADAWHTTISCRATTFAAVSGFPFPAIPIQLARASKVPTPAELQLARHR